MPKYTVTLTRDVTESVVVEILALDRESAETVALEHILNSEEPPEWELDDYPATSEPYVTDVSESGEANSETDGPSLSEALTLAGSLVARD